MRRGYRPGARPGRVAASAMASLSPLPPPEEVFVDWLLSVPHGSDLPGAARAQIELIDDRAHSHPAAQCLRTLLLAMAVDTGMCARQLPGTGRPGFGLG